MEFHELPDAELENIVAKKCSLPPSKSKLLVKVIHNLAGSYDITLCIKRYFVRVDYILQLYFDYTDTICYKATLFADLLDF